MKFKYIFFFTLLTLVILSAKGQTQSFLKVKVDRASKPAHIRFELVSNKMIVRAVINGRERRFIFDTGAETIISKKLFEELKPPVIGMSKAQDQSGLIDTLPTVKIDHLSIGSYAVSGLSASVAEGNQIFDCFQVDGLLGSNMLIHSVVFISKKDSTLFLVNKLEETGIKVNKKDGTEIQLHPLTGSPFIDLLIEGEQFADFVMFDTGFNGFYSIAENRLPFIRQKPSICKIDSGYGTNSIGLFGDAKNTVQYRFGFPSVVIDQTIFNHASAYSTPGGVSLLGLELLNDGNVIIDYPKKKFYFIPFEQGPLTMKDKEFNVSPTLSENKLLVGIVWDDRLRKILSPGDQILAINDLNVETINKCEWMIRTSPFLSYEKLTLTVKNRNGLITKVEVHKW